MKLKITQLLFVSLGLLAGCSSSTEHAERIDHTRPDEVTAFFGENITYSKGQHTAANEPKSTYLEVTIHDDKLAQQYTDLSLPASNCAYLSYKNLPAAERRQYDYLKITMQGAGTAPSYTFPSSELALATQAATNLDMLMTRFKDRDYPAVINTFSPSALTPEMRAQSLSLLTAMEQQNGPVQQYYLEGYEPAQAQLAGKELPLVHLFVTLSHPKKASRLLVAINPGLPPKEQFLYGLDIPN
jgi:hypothetical protein